MLSIIISRHQKWHPIDFNFLQESIRRELCILPCIVGQNDLDFSSFSKRPKADAIILVVGVSAIP